PRGVLDLRAVPTYFEKVGGTSRRARRKARRKRNAEAAVAGRASGPRLPSHLQEKFGNAALELARRELEAGHWRRAFDYAEAARQVDADAARAIMAEASAREAKRASLRGDFAAAEQYAKRAVELRPAWPAYQERRRMIGEAKAAAL